MSRAFQSGTSFTRRVAIEHHDAMADEFVNRYDQMKGDQYASSFSYGRSLIDSLIFSEFDRLPEGSTVLDVGCGTGEYLAAAEARGLHPTGLEPATAMRIEAQSVVGDAKVKDGVSSDLPFDSDSFDLVMALEVFRYLSAQDAAASYREAFRVLKPGGTFIFTMVNRYALDGFFVLEHFRRQMNSGITNQHPHCEFVTPREVAAGVRGAGFSSVAIDGRMVAPLRPIYRMSPSLGARAARSLEPLDRRLTNVKRLAALAGHLVCVAIKPALDIET